MRKTLLLSIALTAINCCFAQNETNNWYFGNHAAINFSGANPVAVTGSSMVCNEGSASISDASGNLLFYTDGVNVYDRTDQLMPNGTGLAGHPSSTQSALIVPKPASANTYYIFTADAGNYVDAPNSGIHFTEVDMSLNGGFGDIVTATKNALLLDSATEKLCGVKHGNGTDVWVMAHGWNDNSFYAFLVTSAGVTVTPVITNSGSVHAGDFDNAIGQMKFSPQGTKLALAVRIAGFFELFDFDNVSGAVANPLLLQIPQFLTAYGLEFSPDGSRLYVNTDTFLSIYQYNLLAGSPADIVNSRVAIGTVNANIAGSMQMAANGKIYVAMSTGLNGYPYLGCINAPNVLGTLCNYTNNAVPLSTGNSFLGLSNFVASYFLPTGIVSITPESNFSLYQSQNKTMVVALEDYAVRNFTLELTDLQGRVFFTKAFAGNNAEVQTNEIKPGVYIATVYANEISLRKKIFVY